MLTVDRQANETLLLKALDRALQLGFAEIKCDTEGYERPNAFLSKEREIEIVPDITGIKGGRKHIIELGLKTDDTVSLKSKWLFLKTLSEMRHQPFLIFTTKGHMSFTNKMIKELDMNVKTLSF